MGAGTKRSPSPWPSPFRSKKVRFLEDVQPSQIRLTVVFGPKTDPKLTIRINIGIDEGHKPTVKVDFARGKKGARPRSRSRSPARSDQASDGEEEEKRGLRKRKDESAAGDKKAGSDRNEPGARSEQGSKRKKRD
ncbi:hypothetical protein CAC42_105 [Sphaceloma murrayae]|uniref:Uncharacterized protein n=1 Tax=Sphaceloma murrayae TaxID=2082308 RepID=A0A2K1QMZ6_9PEZI|nr:hypothetical protein CAC42_105 [Sphaceloma murrayae]